ncbi:hypothetical protein [Cohnella terricola]|uniref:Uncharacterized protein n=1 Tax=Cohnella terricola TaxID=1289167 RepID=A0A559JFG1_9BACL|nr:hypothetical protein [Cohnella terricola]TVX98612.1 hypothetical protein FPZ45_14975 [Cohnella terricola]
MKDDKFLVDEQSLRPFRGRAVCVITNDDIRHTGVLTGCGPKSLVLNGERSARPAKKTRKTKRKVDVSAVTNEQSGFEELPYWGQLSIDPPTLLDMSKSTISLSRIKAVFPL